MLVEQLEDDLWQEGANLTVVQKSIDWCESNWLDSPQLQALLQSLLSAVTDEDNATVKTLFFSCS